MCVPRLTIFKTVSRCCFTNDQVIANERIGTGQSMSHAAAAQRAAAHPAVGSHCPSYCVATADAGLVGVAAFCAVDVGAGAADPRNASKTHQSLQSALQCSSAPGK